MFLSRFFKMVVFFIIMKLFDILYNLYKIVKRLKLGHFLGLKRAILGPYLRPYFGGPEACQGWDPINGKSSGKGSKRAKMGTRD